MFVSHNIDAVAALCSKGMLIQSGRLLEFGSAANVIQAYTKSTGDSGAVVEQRQHIKRHKTTGSYTRDSCSAVVTLRTELCMELPIEDFQLDVAIEDVNGVRLFSVVQKWTHPQK